MKKILSILLLLTIVVFWDVVIREDKSSNITENKINIHTPDEEVKIIEANDYNLKVRVDFSVEEEIDYSNCVYEKEKINLYVKGFSELGFRPLGLSDYKSYCLPKFKIIGRIISGYPDKITIDSCYDGKPYTLTKFKKGDSSFVYNISKAYGNFCADNSDKFFWSYRINYYKDGKLLQEGNSNIREILEKISYNNYFFEKDNIIEIDHIGERINKDGIVLNTTRGRWPRNYVLNSNSGKINTEIYIGNERINFTGIGENLIDKIKGKSDNSKVIHINYGNEGCPDNVISGSYNKEKDYSKCNVKIINKKDLNYTGYHSGFEFKEVSNKEYEILGGKSELSVNEDNKSIITNYIFPGCFITDSGMKGGYDILDSVKIIKFFKNIYTGNYSYLFYDKKDRLLEITHCLGRDGSWTLHYNTFIDGELVGSIN